MTETAAARPSSRFYTDPQRLQVGDLEVAYRRSGSGEPVVFLHGAGGTRMWLPFYERLSETVDLIAPEHPGFGDTEFPDWLDGFDDVVLHYRDFLDELALDRVHLVGFSLGGWIAADLAIFYPERLKSLTLISPAGLHVAGSPEARPVRDAAGADPRPAVQRQRRRSTPTTSRPDQSRRDRPRVTARWGHSRG